MIATANLFAKTIARHPEILSPDTRVLEISAESDGLACRTGRDTQRILVPLAAAGVRGQTLVSLDALKAVLPGDGADVVVAHDLLEYLPPDALDEALGLLLSLATSRLVVLCPCEEQAQACDRSLAEFLRRSGVPAEGWLARCEQVRFPMVRDVYRGLERAGASFDVLGNESMMQHHAGVLLDRLYPPAKAVYEMCAVKSQHVPPVGESPWDLYYNFLFDARPGPRNHSNAPAAEDDVRPREAGLRLYSVFHRPPILGDLGEVRPILVGAAAADAPPDALTDATACGPRLDNSRWCELTAIHRVWREGPVTEAVGFCHYRRFFDFSGEPVRGRGRKVTPGELTSRAAQLSPPPGFVPDLAGDWIITPQPVPLQTTVFSLYSHAHATNDYCRVLNILGRKHPHLMPAITEQLAATRMFAANMFVLPWHLFSEVCTLWFGVLGEYEAATPPGRGTTYQNRDVGFVAERIFDVWVRWKRQQGVPCRTVPVFHLDQP